MSTGPSTVVLVQGWDRSEFSNSVLKLNVERTRIEELLGKRGQSAGVIERATVLAVTTTVPFFSDSGCRIVHFSGHGGLDYKLAKHVSQKLKEHDIPEPASLEAGEALDQECVDAIRKLLAETDAPAAVPLPGLPPDSNEKLTLDMLKGFEAGVMLYPPEGKNEPEIVKPDGFAGLFKVLPSLECVVLNCCAGQLQADQFRALLPSQVKHVIAVRGRIDDRAALAFSTGFYARYAAGSTIEQAYTYGNDVINTEKGLKDREAPFIWSRATGEAPTPEPGEERFQFRLAITAPPEDVIAQERLVHYVLSFLEEAGLPILESDLKIKKSDVLWQLLLLKRDNFRICATAKQELQDELNQIVKNSEFRKQYGQEPINIRRMTEGSVILEVTSPVSIFLEIKTAFDTGQLVKLNGMPLQSIELLQHTADAVGTASAYCRLCAAPNLFPGRKTWFVGLPEIDDAAGLKEDAVPASASRAAAQTAKASLLPVVAATSFELGKSHEQLANACCQALLELLPLELLRKTCSPLAPALTQEGIAPVEYAVRWATRHFADAGLWDWLARTLTDLSYVAARFSDGTGSALLLEYKTAASGVAESHVLHLHGGDFSTRDALEQFERFLGRELHQLSRDPCVLWQLASQQREASAPYAAWEEARVALRVDPGVWKQGFMQTQIYGPGRMEGEPEAKRVLIALRDASITWRLHDAAEASLGELPLGSDSEVIKPTSSKDSTLEVRASDGRQLVLIAERIQLDSWERAIRARIEAAAVPPKQQQQKLGQLASEQREALRSCLVWRNKQQRREERVLTKEFGGIVRCFAILQTGQPGDAHGGSAAGAYAPMRFVVGVGQKVVVCDARNGDVIEESGGSSRVTSIAAGTRWFAAGYEDGAIRVWDAATLDELVTPGQGSGGTAVASLACSPEGDKLVSGSADGTVRVYRTATLEVCATETVYGNSGAGITETCVAFSPDEAKIACACFDAKLQVRDAETLELVWEGPEVEGSSSPLSTAFLEAYGLFRRFLAFKPGSSNIAFFTENSIHVLNTDTQEMVKQEPNYLSSIAYSPDGRMIVATDLRSIMVLDADTLQLKREKQNPHSGRIMDVAFSPDGTKIVSCSEDKTLKVWDAEVLGQGDINEKPHRNRIDLLAFSPDGTKIASGSTIEDCIKVWDADTLQLMSEKREPHGQSDLSSMAFSRDSTKIASCSRDMSMRLWKAGTMELLGEKRNTDSGSRFNAALLSPDNAKIAYWNRYNEPKDIIELWDAETMELLRRKQHGHSDDISSMAFSPNGTKIASCSRDGSIKLWDTEKLERVSEQPHAHSDYIRSAAFSPDNTKIASCSDAGDIKLWDAVSLKLQVEELHAHSNAVSSIAFSPESSELLVSCSYDQTVKVWVIRSLESPTSASPQQPTSRLVLRSVFYAPSPLLSVAVHWPRIVAGSGRGELYHLEAAHA